MKFLLPLLIICSSIAAQAQSVAGEPPSVPEVGTEDVALVIAVEDYAFLPDIKGVRSSATQWETFFRDDLGLKDVRMMIDAQAVREEVLDAATKIGKSTSGRVWVVYVGHGASADGAGLLLGADTQQTMRSIASRGVSQQELLERVNAANVSDVVLVVDACFSGTTSKGEPLLPGLQPVVPVEALTLTGNTLILSAAAGNQVAGSLADGSEPAFSYFLRGAMRGWARGDDDVVQADEAIAFAQRELRSIPGRNQTPQLTGVNTVVLTQGVVEARPEPVATKAAIQSASPQGIGVAASVDSEEESQVWKDFWFSAGAGVGLELKSEDFTPIASLRGGVHLGNSSKYRYRIGAEVTYLQGNNPNHAEMIDGLKKLEADLGPMGRPTDGDKVNRVLTSLVLGTGFDFGFVLTTEATLGLNVAPGGRCAMWEMTDASNPQSDWRCSREESVSVSPVVGGRIGANLGWTDLGVVFHANVAGDDEVFAGLVLSFAMDR